MGNYINNALLGSNPYKKLKDESKALVNKWDKTGLLDGLNEDYEKSSMAILLENQAKQLISEANTTSPAGTGTSNQEEWSGVALPLVRRIFAEIAAQDFVSVQPMNLPSGLVFYLDFKYGKTHAAFSDGDNIHGKTGPKTPSGSASPYPEGGLYGAGRYNYTTNSGSVELTNAGANSYSSTLYTTASLSTLADINYDTEVSASVAKAGATAVLSSLKFVKVSVDALSDYDKTAVRSFHICSGSDGTLKPINSTNTPGAVQFSQFTKFVSSTSGDYIQFVVSGSDIAADTGNLFGGGTSCPISVSYSKQPTETNRGDFEERTPDATVDSLKIPEVDLSLRSETIVAKTRKLKAVWTPEMAQDLNAYHSVDAEAELTSMLSEYISMEIDLEILDMLINDAVTTHYWSAKIGNVWDGNVFSDSSGGTFYGTRYDWYQTFGQAIQLVSNKIHQLTLRGGANFLVCSPIVSTIIESIPGFAGNTDGNQASYNMGVQQIGSLQNRWQVYKNPYMTENTVLVGFRGSNFLETGAVYAPYVPLIMTPLVYDPSDFTPRKGVMTRYAKKMVRPEFYGKIYVSDLNVV